MEKKVTFLFGAGASANCLPIVQDIPAALVEFRDFFLKYKSSSEDKLFDGSFQSAVEDLFIKECDHIIKVLKEKEHASVDTYAKKLRITVPHQKGSLKQYNSLKAILSSFFIYEQLHKKVDNRYDSFFASILDKSHTGFPENVRILSWNYDFQFEKAYSSYSGMPKLSENQSLLRISESSGQWMENPGFGIYKLNGTTALICKDKTGSKAQYLHDELHHYIDKELVKTFIDLFNCITYHTDQYSSAISFAWEDWNQSTLDLLTKAEQAVMGTEVLVIIGYSFPFFNRMVDRRMVKSMKKSLKKVCICSKCGGSGNIPHFAHLNEGICYKCRGNGFIIEELDE